MAVGMNMAERLKEQIIDNWEIVTICLVAIIGGFGPLELV